MSAHEYPVGYGDHVKSLFSRRTAEVQAAFMLPYIRAGMQLLDCGCGFGNLTMDFARLVGDDGRVVGIDVEASYCLLLTAYCSLPTACCPLILVPPQGFEPRTNRL